MKVAMEVPENFAMIRVQLSTFERDNQNLKFKLDTMKSQLDKRQALLTQIKNLKQTMAQ